jgi:hypothetical protein
MNSSKENIVYVGEDVPSQPIFCTNYRVLVLVFRRSPFLLLLSTYEFLSSMGTTLTFPQEDTMVLTTEPFVGTGADPGSTLTTHQQTLTTGPFSNTCKADAVSPEVAIGGCRTHVSTTRGNAKWIQDNNTQQSSYSLPFLSLLRKLYL